MSSCLQQIKEQMLFKLKHKEQFYGKKGGTISTERYCDASVFEKEQRKLASFPKILAPSHLVNDCVLKGKNNYFKNICPHRGAKLVADQEKKTFTCTYHGWTFDEEGSLQSAPGPCSPYREKGIQLIGTQVQEMGGMLLENCGVGDLANEIADIIPAYFYHGSFTKVINGNWKLVVDSLLETYHFQFAHAHSFSDYHNSYFSWGEFFGDNARIIVPSRNFASESGDDTVDIMYFIFPYSFLLVLQKSFIWYRIDPISSGQTKLEVYFFGHQSTASQEMILIEQGMSSLLTEDIAIIEDQQKHLTYMNKYYLTGHELLIQEFHQKLKDILSRD